MRPPASVGAAKPRYPGTTDQHSWTRRSIRLVGEPTHERPGCGARGHVLDDRDKRATRPGTEPGTSPDLNPGLMDPSPAPAGRICRGDEAPPTCVANRPAPTRIGPRRKLRRGLSRPCRRGSDPNGWCARRTGRATRAEVARWLPASSGVLTACNPMRSTARTGRRRRSLLADAARTSSKANRRAATTERRCDRPNHPSVQDRAIPSQSPRTSTSHATPGAYEFADRAWTARPPCERASR